MAGSKRYITEMVVGTATQGAWTQVVTRPIQNGFLMILVKICARTEGELLSLSEIGSELLANLRDKLGEEKSAGEVFETMKKLIPPSDELEIEAGAVLFVGSKVLVSGTAGVETYIVRGDTVGKILSEEGFIEGESRDEDYLVLTTKETVAQVMPSRWKQILAKGRKGVEELAVLVHQKGDGGRLAAVFGGAIKEESPVINSKNKLQAAINNLWKQPLSIKQEQLSTNAWIGAILTMLLIVGVGIGLVQRSRTIGRVAYETMRTTAAQRVDEARSVGDLNPERAAFLLKSARQGIEDYIAKTKDKKYVEEATKMIPELEQIEIEIFKKEEVATNILIEADVLEAGFDPEMMVLDENGSAIMASTVGTDIWGFNLTDKSSWKIEARDAKAIIDLTIDNGKVYLLNTLGVFETDEKKGGGSQTITADDLWKEARLIDRYGGNIYVLDRGQGEIWKYPTLTEGFGARRRWLAPGISLDLSNVSDMAVDGDIWIVTSSGKLERYRRGVPLPYSLEGFPYAEKERLSTPTALYLTEEAIYLVESGAKRVVVLDKESGKYQAQYVNEEFGRAKSLVVSEGKCYLLVDKKIIWFEL